MHRLPRQIVSPNPTAADGGVTWKLSKRIMEVETWLIEGTVVALGNGTLLQYFRTTTGYIWSSTSEDGHAWSPAAPVHLPNPNSKVNMIVRLIPNKPTTLKARDG